MTTTETSTGSSTKRWYVVHAYSGMEKSVARALQERINRAGLQAQFGRIMVPTEEVVEVKGGQKSISERRFFPGYVLVEMELTDEAWHLVKSTPKVTGFVGGSGDASGADLPEGGRQDHGADAGRRRKAAPEDAVRGRRDGAREGRSVHRLQRQRRGSELREEPPARVGDHLRSLDPGGTRVRAGRERSDPDRGRSARARPGCRTRSQRRGSQ